MSEVAPRFSLFPDSTRWEIGGKVFKPCFFEHPTSAGFYRVELLVKRDTGVWDSIWQSTYMWNDIKDQLGVDGMLKSCIRNINPAIAQELGLSFEQQLDMAINTSIEIIGATLIQK